MRDEQLEHLTNGQNTPLPNNSQNLLVLTQINLSQLLMLQLHSVFVWLGLFLGVVVVVVLFVYFQSTTTKSFNQI